MTPRIEVSDLVIRYGEVTAVSGISFNIQAGELVTLLGPSGCGKTSTLRAIAGLEDPSSGVIRLGGQTMYSSAERKNVPTEKRSISMVFQSYAIWPHMTVAENVAYGLTLRRLPKPEIEQTVKRTLDMVRMGGYADRPASKLSGGQQQRIAVARAIAFSPTVLLFDEPLSNLDAKLRTEMRVELRELQRQLDVTSVYVTHDQEEALAISDRIIVMDHGVIEQIGTPETIYNRPGSLFVADFVGAANLVPGRVVDGGVFETVGGVRLAVAEGGKPDGQTVAVRSSYVELRPDGAAVQDGMNVATGTIHRRMFHGDFIQYVVDWPAGQLIVRRPPTEMIAEGTAVRIVFSADHCVLL